VAARGGRVLALARKAAVSEHLPPRQHREEDMQWLVSGADARKAFAADPQNRRYTDLMQHGTMRVGLYALREHDPQKPHTQDEIYIVACGSGAFLNEGERQPFKPGDIIFVKAGAEHRFEDFTDDFQAWVVFWGPDGGEAD
jgi:mannose-6-phosphate isomerase-like protein (cupin superfamily)